MPPMLNLPAILRFAVVIPSLIGGALMLGGCASTSDLDLSRLQTVVIDPGHGGHDTGAIGRQRWGRLLEKDVALDTSLRLERHLKAMGIRTVMTRRDDRFIPLDTRAAISNRYRQSLFVSVHYNYSKKRAVRGVEVYHNDRGTERFAKEVATSVARTSGKPRRLVKTARFRVLRKSNGPALLVEGGYLTNSADAGLCATPEHRERVAKGIADAIQARRAQRF